MLLLKYMWGLQCCYYSKCGVYNVVEKVYVELGMLKCAY